MSLVDVTSALARVPFPSVPDDVDDALIEHSVDYLVSDEALRSVETDTYWPKWSSPWWHMVALFELGQAQRIPRRIVEAMIAGLNALPLKVFPVHPHDSPPGTDPYRDSSCHCALGTMHRVLSACGVEVTTALPWVEPWFERYQMSDGGLNCDGDAYLADECPSSMVATIAPFEAMLTGPATPFLERAAAFLIARRLVEGSGSRHNADERESARTWILPCFPRFYLYDVLRGLSALVRWARTHGRTLPVAAISEVVHTLSSKFPDGIVRLERSSWEGLTTLARVDGEWRRKQPASTFPLLRAASDVGRACPVLTRQWATTRRELQELVEAGRLDD